MKLFIKDYEIIKKMSLYYEPLKCSLLAVFALMSYLRKKEKQKNK